MLTDAQFFKDCEYGYVTPGFRMLAETQAGNWAHHAALLERYPEYGDYCSGLLVHNRFFLDVCGNPYILNMVAQLIGLHSREGNQDFGLFGRAGFPDAPRRPAWWQGAYEPARASGRLSEFFGYVLAEC